MFERRLPRSLAAAALAVLAAEYAITLFVLPFDPSLDKLPSALMVGPLAVAPVLGYLLALGGPLGGLTAERRWWAFAVGCLPALLPSAACWWWHHFGHAEIPMDKLGKAVALVTCVACLGAAAALKAVDRWALGKSRLDGSSADVCNAGVQSA